MDRCYGGWAAGDTTTNVITTGWEEILVVDECQATSAPVAGQQISQQQGIKHQADRHLIDRAKSYSGTRNMVTRI